MDELILVCLNDIRQMVVHRVIAVRTQNLDNAFPSGDSLRL